MKKIPFTPAILTAALTIAVSPAGAGTKHGHAMQFGKHAPFSANDLPDGKFKRKLRKLSAKKRNKAMQRLHSFDFTDHDLTHLDIDKQGDVFYADTFDLTELEDVATSDTVEQPQAVAPEDTFKLHSRPGSSNIIYIDVNGHTISNTAWNSSSASIQAMPFDTDGSPNSFGTTEREQIAEIWHRVAEDFAPFDVDVTTEEPASFGPTTGRILITRSTDASGSLMPHGSAGGVAYVNVWGKSSYAGYYSPALVFYDNLASFPPYIAEASSHEIGHNLGLSHDGTSSSSYYSGHGAGFVSWAPIMGVGYSKNITQWSKGEYSGATQFQDDIGIITQHLTLRTDDHGNDRFNPTPLFVDAEGNIPVTSPEADPHNQSPENKGIIETRGDVDYFAFDAGAGALSITVTPAWDSFYRSSRRGANLDIKATLYDWSGTKVASSDPLDETDAQISATVEPGQFILAVEGVGNNVSPYSDYGSLGQYFISGNVEPFTSSVDTTPPNPNPMSWSVSPYPQSRTSIGMQATTASDESGPVEYRFVCVEGCGDSGWQASAQYTASGLQPGASYSFQVSARDSKGNETNPSPAASATTLANTAPQSNNASVSTAEDSSKNIDLVTLASDPDGDQLSFSIVSAPAHGNAVINNGVVTYTPALNFNGVDSFAYQARDSYGATDNATVSINVTPVNDAPHASISVPSVNDSLTVSFSGSASDPDANETFDYSWNFGDGNGSLDRNPVHTYESAGNYQVALTVTDSQGLSDTVTTTIAVNDPGNALPETPTLTYSVERIVTGRGRRKVVTGTITLNYASNNADNYKIWRCEEFVTGKRKNRTTTCTYGDTPFASTGATTFSTPLGTNPTHYKVTAHNANGDSDFSNEVIIVP